MLTVGAKKTLTLLMTFGLKSYNRQNSYELLNQNVVYKVSAKGEHVQKYFSKDEQ